MLNTPVLLITFNRPTHTRRVLESILSAQPRELYVFQDGIRTGNENDIVKSAQVRETIADMTKGLPVNVHTYYSDKNWGCGAGPMTGITWFFNQVERGIVMEDDCLPHPDFYSYCEELLERYDSNEQVRFINATLYRDRWKCEHSYDFSRYMVTGAWAGWRRTWQGFDLDLNDLDAKKFRRHVWKLTGHIVDATWWYSLVKEIQQDKNKKSYWDYQMQIHLFRENALTIHPRCNLVSNIGFDSEGTHTLDNDCSQGNREVFPILPLDHPTTIAVDKERDFSCWSKSISLGWLKDRIGYIYADLLWSNGIGHKILMRYKKNKGTGINTKKV